MIVTGGPIEFKLNEEIADLLGIAEERTIEIIYRRTWANRLFSWPWRPWKKMAVYTVTNDGPINVSTADGGEISIGFTVRDPRLRHE